MSLLFVVDASVVAAFLLREKDGAKLEPVLQDVMKDKITLHVPALFAYELLNILTMAERRKRISVDQRDHLMNEWALLPFIEDSTPSPGSRIRILAHAYHHNLTAYDAAYIELAERLQARLLSLDADIIKLKKLYRWIV